jgi:protease-4
MKLKWPSCSNPEMAKEQKLVDIIAYEDVIMTLIKKALKVEKDEDYNKVSIFDYKKR